MFYSGALVPLLPRLLRPFTGLLPGSPYYWALNLLSQHPCNRALPPPSLASASVGTKHVAAMSETGGGESSPTPPISFDEAFRRILSKNGKKHLTPEVLKFIKMLEEIPEIALPKDQLINIALSLADKGLVGQFMGCWPSTKTTDEWIQ